MGGGSTKEPPPIPHPEGTPWKDVPFMSSPRDTEVTIVFGRRCLPWSEEEVAKLRTIASQPIERGILAKTFPDRTVPAVRKKLLEVRTEMFPGRIKKMGTPPAGFVQRTQMLAPDAEPFADDYQSVWREKCIDSNSRFVKKLHTVLARAHG